MSGGSTALLFLRMGLSLGIILAMIWGAARVVRRKGIAKVADGTSLQVVGRRSVGRRSSLVVVNAGERTLLLGCTDTQVSLVADLTAGAPVEVTADAPADVLPNRSVPLGAPPAALSEEHDGKDGNVVRIPERSTAGERLTLLDSIRDLTVRRA
jgi:flagellar biosynthetic protein FliO